LAPGRTIVPSDSGTDSRLTFLGLMSAFLVAMLGWLWFLYKAGIWLMNL
jgi:hypothetical protein